PGADLLDQRIALGDRVIAGPDRLAEAKDNLTLADAPGACRHDLAGPEDRDRDDVDAGVERAHEGALLELAQLTGPGSGALRVDDDGDVVTVEPLARHLQRADRRGPVLAAHGVVARGLTGGAEERDVLQLLLGDEYVTLRDHGGEREDVELGLVVRRED